MTASSVLVSARRKVIKRMVMSIVLSLLTSAVVYALQMLAKEQGFDWMAGGKSDDSARSDKAGASSQKHRKVALSCLESPGTQGFDDVGGLQNVKGELRDGVLQALRYPKVFFGDVESLHPPTRLLFSGPPGTGKTMLAKALAVESGVTFMNVTLSTLEDKYFGETPKILKAIFEVAREKSRERPVIVFFDEIDGIMRKRRDDDHSSVYGMKTEFLQHMDKLKGPVVIIGCTNFPDILDPALKRRLPDVYSIPLPDEQQRLDILTRLTRAERKRVPRKILREVAKRCVGHSGSDLKQKYKKACMTRSRRVLPKLHIAEHTDAASVADAFPALTMDDFAVDNGAMGGADNVDDEEAPPS